jgi:hypothetical protein
MHVTARGQMPKTINWWDWRHDQQHDIERKSAPGGERPLSAENTLDDGTWRKANDAARRQAQACTAEIRTIHMLVD